MIYILRIGYTDFVLPTEKGIATVIKTMSAARMVESDDRYAGNGIKLCDGNVTCRMECEPNLSFASGKSRREVIEPEVLPREPYLPSTPRKRPNPFSVIALPDGSRRAVAGEMRRMLGEGE